jgi:hypothetical protein
MAHLKFYQESAKTFRFEHAFFVTNPHALFITKKIARHFKIKLGKVTFRKMKNWGIAHYLTNNITYHNGPSVLVIAEELAHLWQYQTKGKSFHGKQLRGLMRRILNFAEKKNYWIGLSPSVGDKSSASFGGKFNE